MANVQVTFDASQSNARSESSIAINPNNPKQIVAASKKFADIETYDFTLATEYSTDGGHTWHPSPALELPMGATVMTDPTLAWDDSNNVFLVGLTGFNPPAWDTIGIVIYQSGDGGQSWSPPKQIHNSPGDDKQWAAGDANAGSAFKGNVYTVWDNGGLAFARTVDHGATWTGTAGAAAGGIIGTGTVYPEITVADDGTVMIVSTDASSVVSMLVSHDGGDSFQSATDPATGITPLNVHAPTIDGWPVLPGGSFRVITDPTVASRGGITVVAWADYRQGASRIYYVRSTDGGITWSTASGEPLLTQSFPSDVHHVMPQVVVDDRGVFGCVYYEFGPKPTEMLIDVVLSLSYDGGLTFDRTVVTDKPWDPTLDAPWSHGDKAVRFIGDYMGLDASARGFQPLWTDTRTGIQELFTTTVVPHIRPGGGILHEAQWVILFGGAEVDGPGVAVDGSGHGHPIDPLGPVVSSLAASVGQLLHAGLGLPEGEEHEHVSRMAHEALDALVRELGLGHQAKTLLYVTSSSDGYPWCGTRSNGRWVPEPLPTVRRGPNPLG